MNKNELLTIYGSHDASVTFIDKDGNLRVYEYERFVKKRYAMFSSQFDCRTIGSNDQERNNFLKLIVENLQNKNINKIYYAQLNNKDIILLKKYFPNAVFEEKNHHESHVYSALGSSKFKNCIILSIDGGGLDNNQVATTRIYKYKNNILSEIGNPQIDLGNAYSSIGYLIKEIKHGEDGDENNIHSLVYSGKVMGLTAYGDVREEWIDYLYSYYMNHNLSELCSNLGIGNFYNSVSGKIAYDLAATSQFVFEKIIWEILNPFLENEILDVVLVGGCALNVLFNQKLKVFLNKNQKDLFVPCHPNDCGLSFGMFAKEFPEVIEDFNVYSGLEILDLEKLDLYKKSYKNKKFDFNEIVNFLKEGKIIGVVQNNSEIGPRSLGNRSIICLPTFPNMKDIINSKVKFREWYRPFAPVCRDQDINKYFIDAYESPYMSYAPLVNNQYKKDLLSITHVDNTARLQTVNEKTHSFFNSILKELDKNNLVPVILNTSFNIKGFPILSRIEDAFHVLNNTELDVLIIEDTLFYKQ